MNIVEKLGNKGKIEIRDGKKWYIEEVTINNLFDSALQKKFGDEQNLIALINKVIEDRFHCYKKFTFDQLYDMHKLIANKERRSTVCKKYHLSYELLKSLLGEKENRSVLRLREREEAREKSRLTERAVNPRGLYDDEELIQEMQNNAIITYLPLHNSQKKLHKKPLIPIEEIIKPCKSLEDIIHEHNLNASTIDEMIF